MEKYPATFTSPFTLSSTPRRLPGSHSGIFPFAQVIRESPTADTFAPHEKVDCSLDQNHERASGRRGGRERKKRKKHAHVEARLRLTSKDRWRRKEGTMLAQYASGAGRQSCSNRKANRGAHNTAAVVPSTQAGQCATYTAQHVISSFTCGTLYSTRCTGPPVGTGAYLRRRVVAVAAVMHAIIDDFRAQ